MTQPACLPARDVQQIRQHLDRVDTATAAGESREAALEALRLVRAVETALKHSGPIDLAASVAYRWHALRGEADFGVEDAGIRDALNKLAAAYLPDRPRL